MKVYRVVLVALLFSTAVAATEAQARLVTNAASNTSSQPPAANPFAVVDSGAFADEKEGIARVNNAMKQVNTKYDAVNNELKTLGDRLRNLQTDIQKKQATESRTVLQQLNDQGEQLQLQIKRKQEDAQASYQKDMAAALEPLQADIGTALNAYAQAHGILFMIDVNRVPVIYAHTSIDITKDFITEYNKTHPVTGAAPARPATGAPPRP